MVKQIVKDTFFLGQRSEETTADDTQVAIDLADTLNANRSGCVGMAANMIGYMKRTIIVSVGIMDIIMHNPVIVKKSGEYETEEGCLSLTGTRKTKRFKDIEVKYRNMKFEELTQSFSGYVAQIIQHEIDHINGIVI